MAEPVWDGRLDAAALGALVAEHARFPAVLRALVPLDDPERLREREAEGRWSPLEILCHLRDEEVEDFRARAQAAAAEAAAGSIDPAGWVVARAYNADDPGRVLAALEREREASCRWLRELDPAVLDRRPSAPGRLVELRCADLIAAWRMHDLLHLRQLATALARLEARRRAGLAVGYAGTIP